VPQTRRRAVRCVLSFVAGLALAAIIWATAAALGNASLAGLADAIAGIIGLVFAFSLATGLNLGILISIKRLDGDGSSPVDAGAALCVALFSAALLLAGLVTSAVTG